MKMENFEDVLFHAFYLAETLLEYEPDNVENLRVVFDQMKDDLAILESKGVKVIY